MLAVASGIRGIAKRASVLTPQLIPRPNNTPDLHECCEHADRLKVPTKYRRYPHSDDGGEGRRVFHRLRSVAMENFHELIFGIFDGHGQVPTRGLLATQRFADGGRSLSINSPCG